MKPRTATPHSRLTTFEPLEGRRHFTATVTLDGHFGGNGMVKASFGETVNPYGAAQLKNGKLLVSGTIFGASGTQNVFMLYNADGTLSKAFNKTGIIRQSVETSSLFGVCNYVKALPDGSALVIGGFGIHRLRADGTWDSTFGTNGTMGQDLYGITGVNVRSDGSILVLDLEMNGIRTLVYDAHGHEIGSPSRTITDFSATLLPDGRVIGFSQSSKAITLYDSSLQKISSFAAGGTLDLKTATDKYLRTKGPWYEYAKAVTPLNYLTTATAAADGGLILNWTIEGAQWKDTQSLHLTHLSIVLNAAGKVQKIQGASQTSLPGTTFTASRQGFGGVFRYGQGDSADFLLSGVSGDAYFAATAADGSYYVVGQTSEKPNTSEIAIVHTQLVVGSISGTVFGDTNANGKRDSNESIGAGKLVFLDSNNNGVLDAGEATTTTDKNGLYVFSNLGPGQYIVRRVLPKGYRLTTAVKPITLKVGQHATVDIGSR